VNAQGPRSERGLTLVELLIATALLGLLAVTMTSAVFVSMRATTEDRAHLEQSNSEQFLATYLAKDVAAACNPDLAGGPTCARTPNPSTSAGTACGTSVLFAMDTLSDATGAAADMTVGYALDEQHLTRVTCAVGAATPASTNTIAQNVTNLVVSAPTTGSCAHQLKVDVTTAGTTTGVSFAPYSYSLCVRRRA
jgi:prepilin-type N-terminal cleavage/methylation domain-containing protein